jgi:hypothetical protein
VYGQPTGDRGLLDGQRGCHSEDGRSWSALAVKRIRCLKANYRFYEVIQGAGAGQVS